MATVALFAAIIAVCAIITIPTPVPITLQTLGIFMTVNTLGGKRGTAAILLYIMLGAIGLPVFSGGSGGLGVLFGKTGGYMLGFILYGITAQISEKLTKSSLSVTVLTMLIGLALCYASGTAWYMAVYTANHTRLGIIAALKITVLPFVIPDILKLALAAAISKRISKLKPY